ncbi:hypothetical protein CJU89_2654 [Yarrowia sp. B02]|nr:hypothetical protein CJU89_2654 [Yarrowia sp. B02]
MGEYDTKPGGRLKLKGDKSRVTKSKKKKSTKPAMSLPSAKDIAKSPHDTEHAKEPISESPVDSAKAIPIPGARIDKAKVAASTSPVEVTKTPKSPYLTDAQKKFEEAKKERLMENMTKQKPFKERVQDYNDHLSKLTDQNEMPKISG